MIFGKKYRPYRILSLFLGRKISHKKIKYERKASAQNQKAQGIT